MTCLSDYSAFYHGSTTGVNDSCYVLAAGLETESHARHCVRRPTKALCPRNCGRFIVAATDSFTSFDGVSVGVWTVEVYRLA